MTATLIALVVLFLFLFLGLPIGVGMGIVGVAGFAWLIGFGPAMHMLGQTSYDTVVNYNLSVLPLFILMGHLVSQAGLSTKLFEAANAWVGHVKGGLAVASVLACGGFSAVCGSSMATAATMGRVVIPTMRRYGYDSGIASGAVAAAAVPLAYSYHPASCWSSTAFSPNKISEPCSPQEFSQGYSASHFTVRPS